MMNRPNACAGHGWDSLCLGIGATAFAMEWKFGFPTVKRKQDPD